MLVYENLAIGISEENGLFRAYAFNQTTEQFVASAKSDSKKNALSLLFSNLRDDAIEAVK